MELTSRYSDTLDEIREAGLFKSERIITSPQSAEITLADGRTVLNFCANNYLGLADHPDIIAVAKDALDSHGNVNYGDWADDRVVFTLSVGN